ncbi:MAG: phosphatidylcholine/phosphatidylserine synthase [Xanthobacteraceae bacterium]
MSLFPPLDPEQPEPRRRGFRPIPIRTLVPNLVTLLALCAGLTAIRLAAEGRFDLAVAAVVFAAILDGIDGRLARMIRGTSRFGAELDSLADFVNFGVVPALILWFWGLHEVKAFGWIAALVFAICCGLRLARFNVMAEDPNRPAWAANFFVGMPAPGGAIAVFLPVYAHFLGLPKIPSSLDVVYTLVIGFLMISKLPVYSGKKLGNRVPPDMVLPVFVLVVLFFALLISFPWEVMTVGTVSYLLSLPVGWVSYRRHMRADAAGTAVTDPASASVAHGYRQEDPSAPEPLYPDDEDDERPSRLN